jgi:hypothetical protein
MAAAAMALAAQQSAVITKSASMSFFQVLRR